MSIELMSAIWKRGPKDPIQRFVLLSLADYAGEEGTCYPSYTTTAERCAISRSTAIRAVRALEADGWLTTQTRSRDNGSYTSNFVQLNMDKLLAPSVTAPLPLVSQRHHASVTAPLGSSTAPLGSSTAPPLDPLTDPSTDPSTDPGERAAAQPAPVAAASRPTPKPAPVVIHGSRDRTPGGRAPYHGDIPADAPTPVDYRRARPTPELLARQHPAVAAYWVAVGRHPQRKNESLVIEMVGSTPDTAALARAAELWDGSNHNMDNVVGILEWYVELRRNPAWLPSARFKNGKAPAVAPPVAAMKEIAPGLF